MEFVPIKYIIEKQERFGDKGKLEHTTYYIKWRKSFLGLFNYWKYVTHRECGMSDCYNARTNWSSEKKCEKFIKKVLCPGRTYDGTESTIVNEITCS